MRALLAVLTMLGFLTTQVVPATAGALERAMLGKSAIVDLTHVLSQRPVVAGASERPRTDGAGEGDRSEHKRGLPQPEEMTTKLHLPASLTKGKPTISQVLPRELLVHAVVMDVAGKVAQASEYRVTVEDVRAWERRHGRIPKGSAVLLHTGWARRWSDPGRYLNLDSQGVSRVPGLAREAVQFLVGERDIRGVGLDTWRAEISGGNQLADEESRTLLQAGKWELANLNNLDRLPAKGAKLVIAPLRIDAGSAPARVLAILP